MSRTILLLWAAASVLSAADFQDFQAAREVIGQPSFSARERGITARALSVSKNNLFVADNSGRLLTYDWSRLGAASAAACPVCLTIPHASVSQSVFEGASAVAKYGSRVAVADAKGHRVLLWNSGTSASQASLILSSISNPVSVALDNQRLFVGDAGTHHVFVWNSLPTSDAQLPDVTLGVPEGPEGPGADTIQNPIAMASDGTNLFVADSAAHRILVFTSADVAAPQPKNAATLAAGAISPGTLITMEHAWNERSVVLLNGTELPVTETDGNQIQTVIPYSLGNATAASLWLRTEPENGNPTITRPAAIRITPASPGIFAFGVKEPRTGMLLHAPEGMPLGPEDPAKPSDLVTVWATGLGEVSEEADSDGAFKTLIPVHATVNSNPVDVISAVLPAEATGIYEVRLRLPAQLTPSAVLVIMQNDMKSNAVTFPVEPKQD